MCVPVLSAVSTVAGALGSMSSANAQSDSYKQQAATSRANSEYNQSQAANASYNGAQQEQQISLNRKKVTGQQRAGYGASGIDPNSGSAMSVQNSSIMQSLSDQVQTRQNAANQVYGYQTESVVNQDQAKSYDNAASNAKTAGKWGAATSLLSGATGLYNKYSQYKQTGSTKNFMWGGSI